MTKVYVLERVTADGNVLTFPRSFATEKGAENMAKALNVALEPELVGLPTHMRNKWDIYPLPVDDTEREYETFFEVHITSNPLVKIYRTGEIGSRVEVVGTELPEDRFVAPNPEWDFWYCYLYSKNYQELKAKAHWIETKLRNQGNPN